MSRLIVWILFRFSLGDAIRLRMIAVLESSLSHPLNYLIGVGISDGMGLYAIYRGEDVVYVGKATNVGLATRLAQHAKKIRSRCNIDIEDYYFRAIPMTDRWLVRAVEEILIDHYRPEWNKSGFGNHPVGRGRPGVRPSKWDVQYPFLNDGATDEHVRLQHDFREQAGRVGRTDRSPGQEMAREVPDD